jgi:hypothetical protein
VNWATQCEAEVADVDERLMQVDVQLAQASGKALGYVR